MTEDRRKFYQFVKNAVIKTDNNSDNKDEEIPLNTINQNQETEDRRKFYQFVKNAVIKTDNNSDNKDEEILLNTINQNQEQKINDVNKTEKDSILGESDNGVKLIKSEMALEMVLSSEKPLPPNVMSTKGYGNLGYECGCGQFHGVNSSFIEVVACFKPVAFLFKCETYYTKVEIKGFFKQKCFSIYSYKISLLNKVLENLKLK